LQDVGPVCRQASSESGTGNDGKWCSRVCPGKKISQVAWNEARDCDATGETRLVRDGRCMVGPRMPVLPARNLKFRPLKGMCSCGCYWWSFEAVVVRGGGCSRWWSSFEVMIDQGGLRLRRCLEDVSESSAACCRFNLSSGKNDYYVTLNTDPAEQLPPSPI